MPWELASSYAAVSFLRSVRLRAVAAIFHIAILELTSALVEPPRPRFWKCGGRVACTRSFAMSAQISFT